MKLKKIISSFLALSMISALGITSVNAANYENPIIYVDSEVFTDTTATNYKPIDGYTTYLVSYSMEGIDYASGSFVTGFTVDYAVTGDYAEKSFLDSKTTNPPSSKDLNGVYTRSVATVFTMADNQFVFAAADGLWDHLDYTAYPNGESPANVKTLPLIQTLIYVKDDSSVTFTYNTGKNEKGDYTSKIEVLDGAWSDEIIYNVNGKVSNTLTLGASAPAGYDFVEGEKKDITTDDGIHGIVWDGNKMVGFDLVNKKYIATFEAAGAEPKTRELTNLTAATVESDGSIEFDAILRFKDNANPKKAADVTFTVVEE